jgi:hypothetical protein
LIPHVIRRLEQDNRRRGINAEASLRVEITGLPKGARTETRMSGMIKRLAIGRGRAAPSE